MTKQEIEKVVDKLIVRLPIGREFTLDYELSMYFNSILSPIDLNKDKTGIVEDVMDFMIECEYIKYRPTEIDKKLETKGVEAKKAGGHFKYLDSLKPKKEYWLNKYQMIYLPFFILFGFFGIYKYLDNKELKSDYKILKSNFESLTKKYDSVIKQKRILPKQTLNDSLQTKN